MARICREAQGRVRTNVMVRDMDLPQPDVHDGRRLEVVVDGLPLRGGAQWLWTRQWFARCTAMAGHVAERPIMTGVALTAARRKKERTYPELLGPRRRAQLVVIGVEVGRRWSHETRSFFSQLARACARGERSLTRRRAEQAWRMRWGAMFACAAARAVASVGHACCRVMAGMVLEGDHCYAGLVA